MDDNGSLLDPQAFERMISHLDVEDLMMLNHIIVDRIKLVRAERKAQSMAAFEVGDAVYFFNKQEERIDGTVLRLNKKTLSLVTEDGQRWNVAPELCQLDEPITGDLFEQGGAQGGSNVSVLPTAATRSPAKGRWYGGAIEMPAYVSGEEQPYRPFVVMWLDDEGFIVATEICPPEADFKQLALDTLQRAMRSPMSGEPRRPKYITVNDRDLAGFLASAVTGINIEYGDTPMLDDVVGKCSQAMPAGEETDTYLSTGLSAEQISGFFDAATGLYHSAPWQHVPHDVCLLSVTVESLGIHDAVLSVIGQGGENFGIVLYAGVQQYQQYLMASDRMRRGLDCEIPPHVALSFDEGPDVPQSLRREIAEHGWQVANTSSYPVIFTPDRDNIVRPLAAADVALFEALSRALPLVLKKRSKLIQSWNGEGVFVEEITVDSIGDPVTVEIGAPYPFELGFASNDPSDTIMVQLAQLAHTVDEPDAEAHHELCDALQNLFFESPEGKKCTDGVSVLSPLMDFASMYQGATIATLQAGSLEEIVFEIVPRKVMVPPDYAKAIIAECRLFYRFLKRQYALTQADQCLEVLGGNATARLRKALADDSGFGPGKAAIASGMLPGFDDESLPPELFDHSVAGSFGPVAAAKPVDKKTKKRKRKDSKKARKKNR